MIRRGTVALFLLVTVAYLVPLATWLALRAFVGESNGVVGMLNAAGVLWFVPLPPLLLGALLLRTRMTGGLLMLLLLVGLGIFGGEWLPALRPAVAAGPELTVLSFNALVSNQSYDEVERLIDTHAPDVIAIQELSWGMAEALSARVGEAYPYQMLHPWGDPRGIGLMSRYPLTEGPSLTQDGWVRWGQSAIVDMEGQALLLVNVHLWPIGTTDRALFARNLQRQHTQVEVLSAMVVASEMPLLVVGDFNASPTNESYVRLTNVLSDAWRQVAVGPGFTWPSGTLELYGVTAPPLLRIDYMLTRGPISPVTLQVLPPAGSDHLPLLGTFTLDPTLDPP